MKFLLFCLSILSFSLASQTDTILVGDDFNYGAHNGMFELSGGDGWTGPWTRETGDDGIISRGDLGPRVPTVTGREMHANLEFVRAGIRYNRPVNLIQDDGEDLWITVVMDWRPGSVANNVGNVTLTRSGNQVLSFGRKFGNRKIAFVLPGGVSFESDVMAEGVHLLLVKIEFSGDTGQERAYLWVDPEPIQMNPGPDVATADVSIPEDVLRLNSGINGVQLKVEGTPPLNVGFDNLYMGRTIESVLGNYVVSNRTLSITRQPLIVSPIPTNGELQLKWTMPDAGTASTELYDMNGRLIRAISAREHAAGIQSSRINLSELNIARGVYIIRVSGRNWVATERVIYAGH